MVRDMLKYSDSCFKVSLSIGVCGQVVEYERQVVVCLIARMKKGLKAELKLALKYKELNYEFVFICIILLQTSNTTLFRQCLF